MVFETSAVSSLKMIAKPASKWKSMWQWRNQGPGLSVCARADLVIAYWNYERSFAYREANGDVVAGGTGVHDVAADGVNEVRIRAAGGTNNREGVL